MQANDTARREIERLNEIVESLKSEAHNFFPYYAFWVAAIFFSQKRSWSDFRRRSSRCSRRTEDTAQLFVQTNRFSRLVDLDGWSIT